MTAEDFNKRTHEIALDRASGKKRAPVTRVGKDADTFVPANAVNTDPNAPTPGLKTRNIDQEFFAEKSRAGGAFVGGREYSRSKTLPHQNNVANDGTTLGAKHGRLAAVLANQEGVFSGKKQHKKMKRAKQRSGKGYD
jgi:large subunit GTPase 1